MEVATEQASGQWHRWQHRLAPYLFVSPFLLVFAAFGAWPILKSLQLATYATNGPRDPVFVGLNNFRFLLTDADFQVAVRNTAVFAFWSVVLQIPVALALAVVLSQRWVRGRNFFRLAFFAPYLVGSVFVGILFNVLFQPKYGLVNTGLNAIPPHHFPLDYKWLEDAAHVMPALVLAALWLYAGLHMVYFLAALQAVDQDLYEAASVDGAGGWQRFLAVTLPGIRPVAIFVLINSTIGSLQLFDLPFILLNNSAGPNQSGLTIVMYLYSTGFQTGDLGFASAVGWMLALGILVISLIQLRVTGALQGSNE